MHRGDGPQREHAGAGAVAIRRAIGPEATIDGRDSLVLSLPEPVWVDVDAARDALARARAAALTPAAGDPAATVRAAEEALALTGAELLIDLDAEWLGESREALAALRVDAFELIAATARVVDAQRAEAAAREAIALAPFRESARLLLIEALRAQGNVAEALRAYEDVRTLWGTKLDAVMGYSSAFLAYAWLERGDLARARVELGRVDAGRGTSDGARFWLASRAEILLAEASCAEALAVTEQLETMRPAAVHPVWAPWRSLRARALFGLGEGDAARALAAGDLAAARRTGAPWVIGRGLRILGELTPDGTALLREADALLAPTTAGLERAKTARALTRASA